MANYKIEDIEGIGEVTGKKFREAGVKDTDALLAECKKHMPAYMVPARIEVRPGPLPRNPNGKIDRKTLATQTE